MAIEWPRKLLQKQKAKRQVCMCITTLTHFFTINKRQRRQLQIFVSLSKNGYKRSVNSGSQTIPDFLSTVEVTLKFIQVIEGDVLTFLNIVTKWREIKKSKLNNFINNRLFQFFFSHFSLSRRGLNKFILIS